MSKTQAMISSIKRNADNFSRQQILDAINDVLVIVYGKNMAQTIALDDNGQPPVFATTQGVYKYTAPADCREIVAIGIDAGITTGVNYRYGIPIIGNGNDLQFANRIYRVCPVTSLSATPGTTASFKFADDPGTTTDLFHIVYYKLAPSIDTEAEELPLPEEVYYDFRKAVIAILNTTNYGDTNFDDSVLINTCEKIQQVMNRGTQSRVGKTGIQGQDIEAYTIRARGYGRRTI